MTANGDPLRLVVADDHEAYRAGVERAVARAGMLVVGSAASGDDALALVREHAPDIALLDLRMPGMTGSEVALAVVAGGSATRVVILSAYCDPELVTGAVEAGVFGYVSKDAPRSVILAAIQECAEGRPVLPDGSDGLAGRVLGRGSSEPD